MPCTMLTHEQQILNKAFSEPLLQWVECNGFNCPSPIHMYVWVWTSLSLCLQMPWCLMVPGHQQHNDDLDFTITPWKFLHLWILNKRSNDKYVLADQMALLQMVKEIIMKDQDSLYIIVGIPIHERIVFTSKLLPMPYFNIETVFLTIGFPIIKTKWLWWEFLYW